MRQFVFIVSLLIATASSAWAQDNLGEIGQGHEIARKTCAACHRVEKGETGEKFLDVASFQTVANDRTRTKLALLVFLKSPHAKMPDIILTEKEIDSIIAYIMSLR